MEKNEQFKEELEKQYSILIKASEKKEKKYFIIIISILVMTLVGTIISIVFSSIAFRNSKDMNKKAEETMNTYYRTLAVTYNTGDKLELRGIGNGYELSNPKTITITNEGDTKSKFNIKFSGIQTSLISSNNLTYTITSNNETSSPKELPLNEKVIVSEVEIEPEQTITYVIKASYNGQMEENNYTNYYNANIVIEQIGDTAEILG
ncbi:MAG: hypothetical protein II625_00545 [Bacilli bacterium]|nr:hypothetical protein [Bacilli bacterium]